VDDLAAQQRPHKRRELGRVQVHDSRVRQSHGNPQLVLALHSAAPRDSNIKGMWVK